MCWNKVENNCKAIYEYHFIKATIPTERKMLIHIIANEFPEIPRIRIAYAVDRCINEITEHLTPNIFVTFVKGYLN